MLQYDALASSFRRIAPGDAQTIFQLISFLFMSQPSIASMLFFWRTTPTAELPEADATREEPPTEKPITATGPSVRPLTTFAAAKTEPKTYSVTPKSFTRCRGL